MILLANRPLGAYLHRNSVRNLDRIRDCATQVFHAASGAPPYLPARDRPDLAGRRFPQRNTDAPDAEQQVREVLRRLAPDVGYLPSRLPRDVIEVFAGALARGTLRTTLEGMPDLVEVRGFPADQRWWFKVSRVPEAEAMPGNPGVSVRSPADTPHQVAAAMPGGSVAVPSDDTWIVIEE